MSADVFEVELTRISNLDLHHASLKGFAIQGESLLKTLDITKLDISKALGPLVLTVFDNANVGDVAVAEEVGDALDRSIVREVADVRGVRGLVGERLGTGFADRVTLRSLVIGYGMLMSNTYRGRPSLNYHHQSWKSGRRSGR